MYGFSQLSIQVPGYILKQRSDVETGFKVYVWLFDIELREISYVLLLL